MGISEHDKELIQATVQETIKQLKRSGLLRSVTDLAYHEATAMLREHYRDGENNTAVAAALKEVESDKYFKIIPLYFNYGYTIEEIAEVFDVEISTISRNKKRLSLNIYNLIE